jgi:YegS/Rv2252/BmrU family lipid kinase
MSAHVTREVALIVNPSAGGGRAAKALPAVEARLRALGVDLEVDATRDLDHARELAVAGAQRGRVVVTLSGDGMLGAVAGALRDVPGAVVGVLPGGRGNDFARVVGIPLDAEAACDVIAHGVARPVDLGLAGEHPYIGIASVGFDSEANRIANEAPSQLGNLVYAYGALRALAAWRPATFELELDNGEWRTCTGFSVGACNNKAYGGGMYAAPDAELDDGLLDVVYCDDMPKRRFLTVLLPRIFKGTYLELPEVHVVRTRTVRVDADRPFVVYADGDPIGETPATIQILPGAIRVLCPA